MAFLKIVEGAIAGDRPWSDVWADIKKGITQVGQVVVPALETFVDQFLTDFGSQALTLAEGVAPKVLSGEMSIQEAAASIVPGITADAVTDAEKDGTVALNAVRVQITALNSAPAASVAPPETPPAAVAEAPAADDAPIGQTDSLPAVEAPSASTSMS